MFFVYFDYDERKRNDVRYMCKLMNELFRIEIEFVLKKAMKLNTLGTSNGLEICGEYSKGMIYSLWYSDLMDCMHSSPKTVSIELFHRLCVAFGSDLTLE